jgi:hypothetical protein
MERTTLIIMRDLRRICKCFIYHCFSLQRNIRHAIGWLFIISTNRWREQSIYDGVEIYDIVLDNSIKQIAHRHIIRALELVRKVDMRRYYRIKNNINIIYILNLKSNAKYHYVGKMCLIDMRNYNMHMEVENDLHRLAATIVHEATHGVLERKCISYTENSRNRIESLCVKESERFIRRVHSNNLDGTQ